MLVNVWLTLETGVAWFIAPVTDTGLLTVHVYCVLVGISSVIFTIKEDPLHKEATLSEMVGTGFMTALATCVVVQLPEE